MNGEKKHRIFDLITEEEYLDILDNLPKENQSWMIKIRRIHCENGC